MREYWIPGRIELVGKHVDYGGGRSLTCAIHLGLRLRACPLAEPVVRARSADQPDTVVISWSSTAAEMPATAAPSSRGHWGAYLAAVMCRLSRDFPETQAGLDLTFTSTLPAAAGLSSSSALVVATALAAVEANGLRATAAWQTAFPDRLAEAEYFGAMESGAPFGPFAGDHGVGSRGGAQDHVAILCAEDGRVGQFSYLPARREASIPWPDTHRLVVATSGVMAHKTANALAAFNRLSDTLRADTADVVAGRSRRAQFREETETIVPGAAAALAARDWSAFGALVDRSQSLAESVLGNQVAETILLQRLAREQGAIAASAFGAGFGGAVWAMVPTAEAEDFGQRWRGQYLARFPEHADRCRVDITAPAAPACSLAA